MVQMNYFGKYWGKNGNIRPTQDLGDRTVYYSMATQAVGVFAALLSFS